MVYYVFFELHFSLNFAYSKNQTIDNLRNSSPSSARGGLNSLARAGNCLRIESQAYACSPQKYLLKVGWNLASSRKLSR